MTPNHLNGDTIQTPPPTDITDLLRIMRSRSPEESLGVRTDRGLLKSSLQAGAVIGVLFVGLTVGPYLWAKAFPPAPKPTKETTPEPAAVQPAPAGPTTPDTTAKKTDGPAPAVPAKTPAKKDLPSVLGETGTKKGTPADPFGKGGGDDLFKDLK